MPYTDDPNQLYGNTTAEQLALDQAAMAVNYANQQAAMTHMRAAYGPGPMSMMAGVYSGLYSGAQNAFSAIGSQVMPITYAPPAAVMPAYGGMYMQQGGFLRSAARASGFVYAPMGVPEYNYRLLAAEDLGERLGGGAAAATASAAGLLVSSTALRPVGAFVGGAIGSLAGPAGTAVGAFVGQEFGSYAVGMSGVGAVLDAFNARRGLQGYLEGAGFRSFTSSGDATDPRRGQGLSRGGRQEVADFIRQLDFADPTMSTDQLGDVLRKSGELGLFAGSANMDDFKRKFKSIVDNVKVVAQTLHTTLDEGLKAIRELRAAGIEGQSVTDTTLLAGGLGRVAGRTASEMLSIGLQGAEVFRGTGVSMSIGVQANMMNLASIRAARDAGVLSQEAVSQAGGEEALAQRLTAGGLAFAQSAMGRGFNASFFNAGLAGAGLDKGALTKMLMSGGGDFFGQAGLAAQNLGDPRRLIKFEANQEQFVSDLGKQFGGMGLQLVEMSALMSEAGEMVKATGGSTKEDMVNAFKLVAKQQGKTSFEIETMLGMLQNPDKILESKQRAAQAQRSQGLADEAIKNSVFYRAFDRLEDAGHSLADRVARPLSRAADTIGAGVTTLVEEQGMGLVRADVSGINYKGFGAARHAPTGPVDIDQGGLFAQTSGEALLGALESGALGADLKGAVKTASPDKVGAGNIILSNKLSTGSKVGIGAAVALAPFAAPLALLGGLDALPREARYIDANVFKVAQQRAALLGLTESQAHQMQADGRLRELEKSHIADNMVVDLPKLSKLLNATTPEDFFSAFYGRKVSLDSLSSEEVAYARLAVAPFSDLAGKMDTFRAGAVSAGSAADAAAVAKLSASGQRFDEIKGKLTDKLSAVSGIDEFGKGVVEAAARARQLRVQADSLRAAGRGKEAAELMAQSRAAQTEAVAKQSAFMGSEGGTKQISIAVGAMVNSTGAVGKLTDQAGATLAEISSVQSERGTSQLVQAMRTELLAKGDLDRKETLNAQAIASAIDTGGERALFSLQKDDLALLRRSGAAGAKLADLQGALQGLAGLSSDAAPAAIRSQLKDVVTDEKALGGIVSTFMSGGRDQAMNMAYNATMSGIAGDTAAAAANTRGGAVNTETGTANDEYARQTSINVQVAAILNALAARMKI